MRRSWSTRGIRVLGPARSLALAEILPLTQSVLVNSIPLLRRLFAWFFLCESQLGIRIFAARACALGFFLVPTKLDAKEGDHGGG